MAGKLGDMWETLILSLHVCTYVKIMLYITILAHLLTCNWHGLWGQHIFVLHALHANEN